MHFKFTLSGSRSIEGEEAEKIYNIVSNRRMPTGNFWVYWNESEEIANVTITLKTISAKFEIYGVGRNFLSEIVELCTEIKHHLSIDKDTKEIYAQMLKVLDNQDKLNK